MINYIFNVVLADPDFLKFIEDHKVRMEKLDRIKSWS